MEIFTTLATLLLIPLVPAFIIYRFLPSETLVKGPFKGLNVNLTGAFSGYFLLVLISLGLIYSFRNNKLTKELETIHAELNTERKKFQQWSMTGTISAQSPEVTKIFIDGEYPSPSSTGKFNASLFIRYDDNQKIHLPNAVCFYNKNEGYSIVDLTQVHKTSIDTNLKHILIKDPIRLGENDRIWFGQRQ